MISSILYYETIVRSRYNDLFTVSVLKICNVGPEDGGDYLCSGRSGVVSASAQRATTITVLHNEGQCNLIINPIAAYLRVHQN